MEVIIKANYDEISLEAANYVKRLVQNKPNCVLGLATGSTPLGLYKELIRMHREEGLDFSKVYTFNLDEYYGIPHSHEQSYHTFMQENLFQHINVQPERIHVPSGTAEDVKAFCQWYEDEIKRLGGIDLQILGIGRDGHIAFNEPGSSLGSRTRIKTLTQETIEDNARFFGSKDLVPRYAVTMGVGTIFEAKEIILLANGANKAETIAKAVEGPVTAQVTASILQLHPNTIFLLDEAAASKLERNDYYKWVYENKPRHT
ncbi:MAG: glucosamine-6-phosphate deaminase [Candidatus Omnitrophica bacterium]|nr:glucosamine-6-phosphate deaminase [Candidatus Omnitrophota bacterium]